MYEIVNEASYNGKVLYTDSGDTTGKGLRCDIKLPISILEEEKKLVTTKLNELKEKESWSKGEGPQTD